MKNYKKFSEKKYKKFLKKTLKEILDESGAVYYSSIKTLKPGKILILGLNPGGDPEEIEFTIRDSIEEFMKPNYNEYFENWNEEGKEHRLQENLKKIAKIFELDLRDICASNLIFKRSKKESMADFSIIDLCMKVHKKTIKIVKPSIILTFGRIPYEKIKENFGNANFENIEPSGHGKWVIRHFDFMDKNKKIKVIGLPHLSVYTIYNREEKLNWIKERMC